MSGRAIFRSVVVFAVSLVVSFVTSARVASSAYLERGTQPFEQTRALTITGSARKRVTSDLAV
jgi:hypothetical protein